MKVCFIVGTLGRGGAEKQLIYMLRALKNARIDCRILCLTDGEAYESEIRKLNVPIEYIGESKNRVVRLIKIINNLRKKPADILQSSHFYTNIYTGFAGKILKIPSIGAIRSDLTSEIQTHGFLGKWQVSLPQFLIVNSALAYQRSIERGVSPHKIEFVRNVVEGQSKASNESPVQPTVEILFAGRLDKNKRPERFIKLASILIEQFPHIPLRFQIAGDGMLRTELEKLAETLELLPDRLKFLGNCANMSEIYKQSDLLISTSAREGTPNVILEAMAHGLPVIATNVGGTSEILDEKRGILVDPDDEDALISAAAKLIEQPELRRRFGNQGRKYVEQNHSLGNLKVQLQEIYEKLIPAGY